jgi:hypothetical protein
MGFPTSNIFTSVFGRRLGLTQLSSVQTGSARGTREYICGEKAEDIKRTVSVETTATNLPPDGVSRVNGTSAASSAVYTLDPPIPGVQKVLSFESTSQGPIYVKTANGETFISTQGTTFSVIKSTNNTVGLLYLMGLTTAIWGLQNASVSSASFALATTT